MKYEHGVEFAKKMDAEDPLKDFRNQFHIPQDKEGKESVYFCGNSLGPMPKALPDAMKEQMDGWMRVDAHSRNADKASRSNCRWQRHRSRRHGHADRKPAPLDDQFL